MKTSLSTKRKDNGVESLQKRKFKTYPSGRKLINSQVCPLTGLNTGTVVYVICRIFLEIGKKNRSSSPFKRSKVARHLIYASLAVVLKKWSEQMSIDCAEEVDYTTTQNGAKELFYLNRWLETNSIGIGSWKWLGSWGDVFYDWRLKVWLF